MRSSSSWWGRPWASVPPPRPAPASGRWGTASRARCSTRARWSSSGTRSGSRSSGSAAQWPERVYTFAVEEAFWGVEGKTVEVLSGLGGGDCGIEFKPGESYFVHAWHRQYDGAVYAGLCGGTTRASAAGEELRYARRRLAGEPVTALYGRVVRKTRDQEEWEAGTGLPGVRITRRRPRRAAALRRPPAPTASSRSPGRSRASSPSPPTSRGGAGRPLQERVEVPVDGCNGVEFVVRE